jgi:hypothetical protein
MISELEDELTKWKMSIDTKIISGNWLMEATNTSGVLIHHERIEIKENFFIEISENSNTNKINRIVSFIFNPETQRIKMVISKIEQGIERIRYFNLILDNSHKIMSGGFNHNDLVTFNKE